jgi:NhaA family Na+:H+ antiporter
MFEKFFKSEAASGMLLLAVTMMALVIANSPLASLYDGALHGYFAGLSVLHWINDGLMALFFLLVGLEIRHELSGGELSTWDRRALPGLAALGGMIAPALTYMAFNRADPAALHGWAIPTATDIAFSLGVLAMLGANLPTSLKVFLTALAIIDDLLAVLIIALFYGNGLSVMFLALSALTVLLMILLRRFHAVSSWAFLLLGALLWFFVLKSGIHATLAGVMLAFCVPTRLAHGLEEGLANWVAWLVVPVFAFANAGVSLAGISAATLLQPVTLGVTAGLVLGKQVGVFGAAWLAVRLGLARRPAGASWLHVYGVSILCGIGFTISLFIGALAFAGADQQAAAKLGVLTGSLVAGLLGWLVLGAAGRRTA